MGSHGESPPSTGGKAGCGGCGPPRRGRLTPYRLVAPSAAQGRQPPGEALTAPGAGLGLPSQLSVGVLPSGRDGSHSASSHILSHSLRPKRRAGRCQQGSTCSTCFSFYSLKPSGPHPLRPQGPEELSHAHPMLVPGEGACASTDGPGNTVIHWLGPAHCLSNRNPRSGGQKTRNYYSEATVRTSESLCIVYRVFRRIRRPPNFTVKT
uniref:Uncharacterized protein n=1 Tax=Pipistrellus kuhlii TaxID=59472 RepID=A0A7J7SVE6_PIPKU|nr:hypothetical protein mPipKuh1_009764 [Pipistrellus kuhlii]